MTKTNLSEHSWVVELLQRWAATESFQTHHDRSHPMWRRALGLAEPAESEEMGALRAAIEALPPEQLAAITKEFKPWIGAAAPATDSTVLTTAITRLADAVDAAMGD